MSLARRILTPIVVVLASSSIACGEAPRKFTSAQVEGARLFYQEGIPIAVLSGTPEQIGRQHASLLAEPAARTITFPRRYAAEMGAEALWPLLVKVGDSLVKNAPARHQQELAALSSASHLDRGEIAVGNTLLELRRMGCSVLIVEPEHSATGGPLFGRNFDFPTLGELDQFSLLFVCRPEGRHAFASVTFPAAIGAISGMNDAGLAIATLDVYQSDDDSAAFDPTGTPLAFVFRRILEECTTVAEAETLLRSEKPTTWMNLAVCDRADAAVFEITPKHISRRDPEHGVLPCTNHFRTAGLAVEEVEKDCWRYPKLAEAAQAAPLGIEEVRQYLDAANQGEFTLQTMVFEPRELSLHLAIGKPPTSDDALTRIDLRPLFSEGLSSTATGPPAQ